MGSLQSSCIFLSSFSILLIAVDRYLFILCPMTHQIDIHMVSIRTTCGIFYKLIRTIHLADFARHNKFPSQAFILSLLSLLLSTLMSSPLFLLTKLKVRKNLLTDQDTSFCYEVRS